MLTRCAKAYSSFCSQIALGQDNLQPFPCNSLLKCAARGAAKDCRKKQ